MCALQLNRKFGKREHLCSLKTINTLFASGKTLKIYPFKIIYNQESYNLSDVKIMISVPKKLHRRAVRRNLLRRRIREAYRLNKHILGEITAKNEHTFNVVLLYMSNEIMDYGRIEKKLVAGLHKLVENIKKNADIRTDNTD